MNLLGALSLTILLAGSPPPDKAADKAIDPFAAASMAPADATCYVHVEGAAGIRKELADRPIAGWLNNVFQSGQCHDAWMHLARSAKLDQGALFDLCLGRRFTLIMRSNNEWALITDIDLESGTQFLGQIKPRVRPPQSGMAVFELPEQELLIARADRAMVLGPAKQSKLFFEVLPRISTTKASAGGRGGQPWITQGRELGSGCVGVYLKHDPPLGGYSLAVADLQGDQLAIHHAAHFMSAPFNHGVTKLKCDFSPVQKFEDCALVAFIQPMDVGDGPIEAFVTASLHQGLISQKMREMLGMRRLIVVGERDLRQAQKPVDLLSTTFVSCLELKDRHGAAEELDQQMVKLAKHVNDMAKGSFLIQTPNMRCWRVGEPREVDLSPATQWFSGGFPIMKSVALTWTVADGPQGSWFVIGSERQSLEDVVKQLKSECPRDTRFVGQFDSCGSANGHRICKHFRNWSDQADQFAEPANVEDFRATLRMMSELAGGVQSCHWQLARPSANDMKLDVQIQLSAPESSRGD